MSQLNTRVGLSEKKLEGFENSILWIEIGNETITTAIGIQSTKLKKWLVVYIITQQHNIAPILTNQGDICDVYHYHYHVMPPREYINIIFILIKLLSL